MNKKQIELDILRKIHKEPDINQRLLASYLGFSVGKLNYCIKSLKAKGLLKIDNFKKNPKKINYLYMLTPKGVAEKTKLTVLFMKKKMEEYDELEKELESKKKKI
jgi:EPS-associated MarR family transcriptional regulator